MIWSLIRPIFKTSSVTPDFFYVFNLILSFSTCSQSFKKICTWELLGANVLNRKNLYKETNSVETLFTSFGNHADSIILKCFLPSVVDRIMGVSPKKSHNFRSWGVGGGGCSSYVCSFKSFQGYRDSVNQALQSSSLISKPLLENEKQHNNNSTFFAFLFCFFDFICTLLSVTHKHAYKIHCVFFFSN